MLKELMGKLLISKWCSQGFLFVLTATVLRRASHLKVDGMKASVDWLAINADVLKWKQEKK